jgi:hypothetical protein
MTPMAPDQAWAELGIECTSDLLRIRTAYARRLKAIDLDEDPEAFIRLREAAGLAMHLAAEATREQEEAAEGLAADQPGEDMAQPGPATAAAGVAAPEDSVSGAEAATATQAPVPESAEDGASIPEHVELIRAIEAILFGADARDRSEELGALTARLLDDPALEQISTADAVENWIARAIARSAPRSDPMLDLVVPHFGWASKTHEWTTSPILDWLVQRQVDADFERRLIEARPEFATALELLRAPEPPTPRSAWRHAPEVRSFLEYAGAMHPTSLTVSEAETVRWWEQYLYHGPRLRRELDAIRRMWRGTSDITSILIPIRRSVELPLGIGIFLAPYVFAWAVLRPGYSRFARITSFLWMAVMVAYLQLQPEPPSRPPPPFQSSYEAAADITPILQSISPGLELWKVEAENPDLGRRLMSRWTQAKETATPQGLGEEIRSVLEEAVRERLRHGDYPLLVRYWRLHADRLIWLRDSAAGGGVGACQAFISGQHSPNFPYSLSLRHVEVMEEILLASDHRPGRAAASQGAASDGPARRARLDSSARRAKLDDANILAGLGRIVSGARSCSDRISMIETALDLPPQQATLVLRELEPVISPERPGDNFVR